MENVFSYKDYKTYLKGIEKSRKAYERGFRSKLAEVLGCQSGYISHVLNGSAHLSLEQSMKAAQFLGLSTKERKYLLLLVEHARAGTHELKSHFENELKLLKDEHLNLKSHVGTSSILSEVDQSTYYSSWLYLAVHVVCSLPGYSNAKAIAQALRLSEGAVGQVLLFLVRTGIVKEAKGILKPGLTQIHLNRESPLIRQHHTNCRVAAIQSLMNEDKEDVHYSTVSTLSKDDAEKLRVDMVKLIEHYVSVIKPSKDEVMYGFNLDFYSLIKK